MHACTRTHNDLRLAVVESTLAVVESTLAVVVSLPLSLSLVQAWPSCPHQRPQCGFSAERTGKDEDGALCGYTLHPDARVSVRTFVPGHNYYGSEIIRYVICLPCSCRTELAHQAQLVQLQEETIRSLMVEVCTSVHSICTCCLYSPSPPPPPPLPQPRVHTRCLCTCVQVDALQQWKARVERDQKNKAATVIQKYW